MVINSLLACYDLLELHNYITHTHTHTQSQKKCVVSSVSLKHTASRAVRCNPCPELSVCVCVYVCVCVCVCVLGAGQMRGVCVCVCVCVGGQMMMLVYLAGQNLLQSDLNPHQHPEQTQTLM